MTELAKALAAFHADLPEVGKGSINPAFHSPEEEWRPVVGDPNYEVSSLGRVRSLTRTVMRSNGAPQRLPGRILSGRNSNGYRLAGLSGGRPKYVHALVLEAFTGPRPDGAEACHADGDRANNRLTNLRWDSRSANAQDAIRHGKNDRLNRTHCPRGHALQEPNLVASIAAIGSRSCLACSRAKAWGRHHGQPLNPVIADDYYARITEDRTHV